MELFVRTKLEIRLRTMRLHMLELGRFGRNEQFYMEWLAKLENNARAAREELERSLIQEKLF